MLVLPLVKDPLNVIGLMSGTSHDGVDAALVGIAGGGNGRPSLSLIKHVHVPYDRAVKDEVRAAFGYGEVAGAAAAYAAEHICRLNFKLGEVLARAVEKLIKTSGVKHKDIDAIASHGQTIYHIPPESGRHGSTLQIGESAVIARRTGILTVSDFRTADMAEGGHGAPLAPLADYLMFHQKGRRRAVLNVGGIANVTIVGGRIDDTIAFDTGPGNSLMDEAVRAFTDGKESFDKSGKRAAAGAVDTRLINELLADPYFKKSPPKSTGREYFGAAFVEAVIKHHRNLSCEDVLATLAYLTAVSIYDAILPYEPDEVILTGGGCRNRFLTSRIEQIFKRRNIAVNPISDYGIEPEAKEAVSFALLGYRTLKCLHGNLPSATGSKAKVILGKITLP
jgi:anhydro-N-acetylmuramic acid kinase